MTVSRIAVPPGSPGHVADALSPDDQEGGVSQPWTPAAALALRFAVIFFGITAAGELMQYVPAGGKAWLAWSNAKTAISTWVINSVLGLPAHSSSIGIEPLQPFVFQSLLALTGLVTAILWHALDRRSSDHERLYGWLHALVRFALAAVMFDYGWAKIFPSQFGFGVSLGEITKPVGDLTPQRLLWVFMAASRPYAIFGGFLEILGALLLCGSRTATAGALILIGTLANVVMLNFAYDVNVRVYSTTLLLMALFIAARDLPRLSRAVLGSDAPAPPAVTSSGRTPKWNRVAQWTAAAMTVWLLYRTIAPNVVVHRSYAAAINRMPRPLLDGIFEVEEYERTGVADSLRWTRIAFVPEGVGAWVHFAANTDTPFRVQRDETTSTVVLTSAFPPTDSLRLSYARVDSSRVMLGGTAGQDSVRMLLRRVDLSSFRLLKSTAFWRW